MSKNQHKHIEKVLSAAVKLASENNEGKVASYIPELASMPEDYTAASVKLADGKSITVSNCPNQPVTLQSAAKLVIFIGLLEESGLDQILNWVKVEPSGDDFNSVARLDQFGPRPSNPMLNSGAMALCSRIPGKHEEQLHWLESWMTTLFGAPLAINTRVFASEKRTGDRNRSLAYLMRANNSVKNDVDDFLENYFYLCSYETTVEIAAHLPMLISNLGVNEKGERVFSEETALTVSAVMSTCGLYNETGAHMVTTGLPAKSSVSGLILASAPGEAGVCVFSPRVNTKGTSSRGAIILEHLSQELGWHFARRNN